MNNADYQYALLLQKQFEYENNSTASIIQNYKSPTKRTTLKEISNTNTKSLIDPSWELVDPTPNIHQLFMVYNERFFWNKLLSVCVDWSKKMTRCAGICSYQGRGGLCQITLSEPLLKLRPRKDLVETLLHEMIHAFLFVTHNNKDRDGHGPEFHKHMYRINNESGTNITVYHDFHDEVELYLQHWWKCNGPCQHRKPYFGIVRRAMNRAPGPSDKWWADHSRTCGGTFVKFKEPEKPTKKGTKSTKQAPPASNDIRKFFSPTKSNSNQSINNVPVFKKPKNPTKPQLNDNANIKNIHGFHDVDKLNSNKKEIKGGMKMNAGTLVITKPSTSTKQENKDVEVNLKINLFSGSGNSLTPNATKTTKSYDEVRNHWLNKFDQPTSTKRSNNTNIGSSSPKRPKIDEKFIACIICDEKIPANLINAHIDECLALSDDFVECYNCKEKFSESEIARHIENCVNFKDNDDEFLNMKKCEICYEYVKSSDYDAHKMQCLQNISQSVDLNQTTITKTCDICQNEIEENIFNGHLASCLTLELEKLNERVEHDKLQEHSNASDVTVREDNNEKLTCVVCNKVFFQSQFQEHLKECRDAILLDDADLSSVLEDNVVEPTDTVTCPACSKNVLAKDINAHLDSCLC